MSSQMPLEIEPAHAGHMNVGDYAIARTFQVSRNKFFRGRKVAHAITERAKRFNKCCSEGFIIVNNRN
jgi:hypothetical protein